MYQHQEYISARPKSGYRRRSEGVDYDSYARVTDSPRAQPPPRPMSRRKMEGPTINHSDSDDNYLPSSPDGPLVSPKSPTLDSHRYHPTNQNRRTDSTSDFMGHSCSPTSSRPPTSGSMRPPSASARRRSARLRHKDSDMSHMFENDSQDSLPSMSAIRPPSSFSKYRPLPAIGTPTPTEPEDHQKFLFNDTPNESMSRNERLYSNNSPQDANINRQSSHSQNNYLGLTHGRISSAVSDISVISTKANSSRRTSENSAPSELIERLDLSQLEKPSESARRRKQSSNQSPLHKPKAGIPTRSKFDAGELYDGDDDDSDTNNIDCVNTFVQGKKETLQDSSRPSVVAKDPVIIPSENQLAAANSLEQEILLAVKLPTNGTRHQRYFQRSDSLMSIVEFAEEQAGQDFAGYILVSSAPKNVYEDLRQTIEEAGLEDRSVLHLEELD